MLPASGQIKLKGTTGDTNAVSIEIYGTPTNLALTAAAVKSLFGWVSGVIKLTYGYSKCSSNCACDADCGCDADGCGTYCPGPDVPLLMADGTEKLAGNMVVGDVVLAWNEVTQTLSPRKVTSVKLDHNTRMAVTFSSGRSGEFAANHRFLTNEHKWVELRALKLGDILSTGVSVRDIVLTGNGPVVAITVEDLHTYITLGVVSHNVKNCPPGV